MTVVYRHGRDGGRPLRKSGDRNSTKPSGSRHYLVIIAGLSDGRKVLLACESGQPLEQGNPGVVMSAEPTRDRGSEATGWDRLTVAQRWSHPLRGGVDPKLAEATPSTSGPGTIAAGTYKSMNVDGNTLRQRIDQPAAKLSASPTRMAFAD